MNSEDSAPYFVILFPEGIQRSVSRDTLLRLQKEFDLSKCRLFVTDKKRAGYFDFFGPVEIDNYDNVFGKVK